MLLVVGEARQPVLAPVIGAGARLVMAEVIPGIAIGAVVFAYGAPLALAEVGPPFAPQDATLPRLREALLLRRARCCRHRVAPFFRASVGAGPTYFGLPLIAPHR